MSWSSFGKIKQSKPGGLVDHPDYLFNARGRGEEGK
jgi:hypothetical protein